MDHFIFLTIPYQKMSLSLSLSLPPYIYTRYATYTKTSYDKYTLKQINQVTKCWSNIIYLIFIDYQSGFLWDLFDHNQMQFVH